MHDGKGKNPPASRRETRTQPEPRDCGSPSDSAIRSKRRFRPSQKIYYDAHGSRRELRPLTEDQRRLAVRHLPLARALTRRLESLWPSERDDLRSTAYMALVDAARTFDVNRGISFSTYARRRIRGHLSEYRRLLYSAGWRGSKAQYPALQILGDPPKVQESVGQVVGIYPDPPVGQQLEETEAVEAWLRRLPERLAAACRLIYLFGSTHSEAAKAVGCSRSRFSRLHDEAMIRLSQEHQEYRVRPQDSAELGPEDSD
jgi:RNA polymerase sigma factor (sigma-70 family)